MRLALMFFGQLSTAFTISPNLLLIEKPTTIAPMLTATHLMSSRLWGVLVLLVGLFALLGCERYKPLPQCSDSIAPGDMQGWRLESAGTAVDPKTGLRWYRCNAGEKFLANQCMGVPLELSFADAKAYVAEVAGASGQPWRLPTASEVEQIQQTACTNPAINSQIFPSVLVENYWVDSKGTIGRGNACAFYSYSGNISCLESADETRPFWMVLPSR